MSPRKSPQFITIEPQPELKLNRIYEGLIKGLKINSKKSVLEVVCENRDRSQYGRSHLIYLPLSAWPGNPTSLFLKCLGVDTAQIGKQIPLETLIGKRIGVKFRRLDTALLDHTCVEFVQPKEGTTNGDDP